MVHLHREHVYKSLDAIKEELSGYAMELAPPDLESNSQVPFLSLGEDEVGDRAERCRGKSELSGEFVVEDISANGELFRRLIFFNNKKQNWLSKQLSIYITLRVIVISSYTLMKF